MQYIQHQIERGMQSGTGCEREQFEYVTRRADNASYVELKESEEQMTSWKLPPTTDVRKQLKGFLPASALEVLPLEHLSVATLGTTNVADQQSLNFFFGKTVTSSKVDRKFYAFQTSGQKTLCVHYIRLSGRFRSQALPFQSNVGEMEVEYKRKEYLINPTCISDGSLMEDMVAKMKNSVDTWSP